MRALPLLLLPAVVLIGTCSAPAGPREKNGLDPELPYQARKGNPVTYDVEFVAVVTAPAHTRLLRVWLPLPPSDAGQEVQEKGFRIFPLTVAPRIAREAVFGNRFAYFEFPHPEGAQVIRHTFKVKVWELHWDVDPPKVTAVRQWPAGFEKYLRSDRSVVVSDRLRTLAAAIVPRSRGPAADLAAVLGWVNEHVKYDHADASLRASSEHALKLGHGHCSDYHGLCAAFGRGLGFPTRVTYGINPFPKNSPSHCKLEAFLPPYGWVSFDVSETQQLMARIRKDGRLGAADMDRLVRAARRRLLGGFRDNTWFVQTRGTDYDLAPPAAHKVAVVRTLYAEADGVALPDPDPANPGKREFAWMTAHRYTPDRTVPYPFKDWSSLQPR